MTNAPACGAGALVGKSDRALGKPVSSADTLTAQVFTINEFCRAHRLSRAMLYKLLKEGRGPRLMRVGSRRLVSQEAAADWRRTMEGAQ